MDGIGRHHLAHVADVNLPGWGDAGVDYVAVAALAADVVSEEIRPVPSLCCRRHSPFVGPAPLLRPAGFAGNAGRRPASQPGCGGACTDDVVKRFVTIL